MELPDTIKIGYLDYLVDTCDEGQRTATDRAGECDRIAAEIRVVAELPPARAAEALLREVMHACCGQWCNTGDPALEDKIVSGLASGLATTFRDNPGLVDWLATRLKE
jgi:hypothetical protein